MEGHRGPRTLLSPLPLTHHRRMFAILAAGSPPPRRAAPFSFLQSGWSTLDDTAQQARDDTTGGASGHGRSAALDIETIEAQVRRVGVALRVEWSAVRGRGGLLNRVHASLDTPGIPSC